MTLKEKGEDYDPLAKDIKHCVADHYVARDNN